MARREVGKILKGKDGKPDYVELKEDVSKGFYSLESKASQLKSLEQAVEDGKISEEVAEKKRENINKMPDFIRFNIVQYTKNS